MRGPEVPVVRRPPAPGDAPLPRWWSRGNRFGTHLGNGMNFVFPAGERFFIRSVRFYADGLTDPALKARVAAFAAQEAWHQKAHLDLFADLESQGFEVRSFLDWYERWAYQHIEPQRRARALDGHLRRDGARHPAARRGGPAHGRGAAMARRRGDRAPGRRL